MMMIALAVIVSVVVVVVVMVMMIDDDDGDDGDEDALTSYFEKCFPVCQCDIDESCPIPQFDLYKCVTCGKVLSGDDLSQEDHQQQCLGV